ncbi:hypothetical protein ACFRQM_40195 [Streptomyces sp. NPDC056831]|uniref:hypothetical protein n=1 Tax=Streptomyces sp. NPDC056831 TaxID=3345954 RepID=UPI0036AC9DDB
METISQMFSIGVAMEIPDVRRSFIEIPGRHGTILTTPAVGRPTPWPRPLGSTATIRSSPLSTVPLFFSAARSASRRFVPRHPVADLRKGALLTKDAAAAA